MATTSRRTFLKGALGGAGALVLPTVLTGCGGDDDSESGGGSGDRLEVFSWWTGGGEAAGLEAMIEIWNRDHPDVTFENAAVVGGAGSNAKAVLAQRLEAGDPPDSFQGHAGAELSDYITAGQIEPIDDLYDRFGLDDVFPADLLEQITVDGEVHSVPVNIHRANVLWFSPSVLEAAGIGGAPTSIDEWFIALDQARAAGVTPLSLAESWTVKHLMETAFIGVLGADGWSRLWTPAGDWTSSEVTEALDTFKRLLGYTNGDSASLTWQDAAEQVVDGRAAFNVMGDWVDGYFQELRKVPEVDYGWAAVPGTDGIYDWLSDSFTLPVDAPHRDNAVDWLELCGSREGQDAFNPVKGSIPARTDADVTKYGVYLRDAIQEWSSSRLVGSLTHGVVANNAWNEEIDGALGLFLEGEDVASFQEALTMAHEGAGGT